MINIDDEPMPRNDEEKIRTALVMLLDWSTNGDRSGNPYCVPAVKLAISALRDADQCPATWGDIARKEFSVYLKETIQEHDKRKNQE